MDNVATLGARLQKLRTEIEIAQRRRDEEAKKAYKALSSISMEDVSLLESVVPGLKVITQYSVADICNNKNGEIDNILSVTNTLQSYLEQRLSFYEGQL